MALSGHPIAYFSNMNHPQRFALFSGIILLATGVIFGAFGAHALKEVLSSQSLSSYHTAVDYQFYHGLGLLALCWWPTDWRNGSFRWGVRLLLLGTLLFCGSIYGLTLGPLVTESASNWLGPVTPIGGLCFIVGWLFVGISARQNQA